MKPTFSNLCGMFLIIAAFISCEERPSATNTTSPSLAPSPSEANRTSPITMSTAPPLARASSSESQPKSNYGPTLSEQALLEAQRCLAAHFLQRGDSWVGLVRDDWNEYQSPSFSVRPATSAADRLNGYEFRADVVVSFAAHHAAYYNADGYTTTNREGASTLHWEKWKDGGELEFKIVKQQGVWTCLGMENYSRGDPREIPR